MVSKVPSCTVRHAFSFGWAALLGRCYQLAPNGVSHSPYERPPTPGGGVGGASSPKPVLIWP
jgi:hypothetical protein